MGLGIRQVGQHIAKVLAREFGSLNRDHGGGSGTVSANPEIGPEISDELGSLLV